MATRYEYYVSDDDVGVHTYGVLVRAQTFTPSVNHIITSVKFKLYRVGSPGIALPITIRATDGDGKPTGSALASGTTNGNTLTTSSAGEWREITLGAGALLIAETKYAMLISAPDGDTDNAVRVRSDNSSANYLRGTAGDSDDGGSTWNIFPTYDLMFEDLGDPQGSSPSGSISPTDAVARVSSIRHIFRPGFFRMQVGLGDLGFDVDIAESTVRKALDTAKEAEPGPGYPEILEVLGMTAEEFAKMGREISARRRVSTDFSAYEEQIAYEEWFQKQMEELRRMQE